MWSRPRTLFVAALLVMASFTAMAQRGQTLARRGAGVQLAARWVAAVIRHQSGEADAEVRAIVAVEAPVLEELAIEVITLRRLIREPRTNYFTLPGRTAGSTPLQILYTDAELDTLRRAARDAAAAGLTDVDLVTRGILLHTDIATLGGGVGQQIQFSDGRTLGMVDGPDHWRAARSLAGLLESKAGRDADVRLWYRATIVAMLAGESWHLTHAEVATEQFADDPELHFLAGVIHEGLSSAYVQASIPRQNRFTSTTTVRIGSPGRELQLAADRFERALDLAPAHAEASLRYGRVLTLLGRPADAVAHLRRAESGASEKEQRYYAALFLGSALEALNRTGDARDAYQRAAALYPAAQSPALAASHLAARSGQRADAISAIEPLLALPPSEAGREDPWLSYRTSPGRDADTLMADTRKRLAGRATEGAR